MENILIIFTACLPLLFIVFLLKPKYGLFLLLISRPIIDNIDAFWTAKIPFFEGLNVLKIIGIILPIILISVCFLKKLDGAQKDIFFFKYRTANYYFLFLIACLPAVAFSGHVVLHAGDWLKFFTLWAILIFSLNYLHTEKDFKQVFLCVIISSIYPLIGFIFDFITDNTVMLNGYERYIAGYPNQGVVSTFLVCFIPAYLFFIFDTKNKKLSILLTIILLFLFICIVSTLSRTSIYVSFVLLMLFLLFRRKYYFFLGILSLAVIAIICIPELRGRITSTFSAFLHIKEMFGVNPSKYDYLMTGRFLIYREVITTLLYKSSVLNLIFGFGYDIPLKLAAWADSAHNDFLQITFRYGIFSAILFYFFISSVLFNKLNHKEDLFFQTMLSFIWGFTLISVIGNPFSAPRFLWYVGPYIAIILKYQDLIIKENKKVGIISP